MSISNPKDAKRVTNDLLDHVHSHPNRGRALRWIMDLWDFRQCGQVKTAEVGTGAGGVPTLDGVPVIVDPGRTHVTLVAEMAFSEADVEAKRQRDLERIHRYHHPPESPPALRQYVHEEADGSQRLVVEGLDRSGGVLWRQETPWKPPADDEPQPPGGCVYTERSGEQRFLEHLCRMIDGLDPRIYTGPGPNLDSHKLYEILRSRLRLLLRCPPAARPALGETR